MLLYVPAYKHTYLSEVNTSRLPSKVAAVRGGRDGMETVEIAIKGPEGEILPNAIPSVSIVKDGGYCGEEFGEDPALEPDLAFLVEHKLGTGRLARFTPQRPIPDGSI